MNLQEQLGFTPHTELEEILTACPGFVVARNKVDLFKLAMRDEQNGVHKVIYDIPGKGPFTEVEVCRVKNGIAANYTEPYMRRRDPDCMVIADDRPTDKPRYADLFNRDFGDLRQETFDWLKTQELALFPFLAVAKGIVGFRHGSRADQAGISGAAFIGAFSQAEKSNEGNYVLSVDSFSFRDEPGTNYGPYLDSSFKDLFDYVERGCR